MLDLQTIKSYDLHFETLEIKSSGNPISLPQMIPFCHETASQETL